MQGNAVPGGLFFKAVLSFDAVAESQGVVAQTYDGVSDAGVFLVGFGVAADYAGQSAFVCKCLILMRMAADNHIGTFGFDKFAEFYGIGHFRTEGTVQEEDAVVVGRQGLYPLEAFPWNERRLHYVYLWTAGAAYETPAFVFEAEAFAA